MVMHLIGKIRAWAHCLCDFDGSFLVLSPVQIAGVLPDSCWTCTCTGAFCTSLLSDPLLFSLCVHLTYILHDLFRFDAYGYK